ncbi:MAG: T9SS type A sorting domain-containing protein [Bacteroidetes bacterium]|nr:T9SS type A sorting domain-containing protein [Bacteroidota bacterium]
MKNIHKNLLLVILTFNFCFYSLSYSQNIPTIQWQNTIGGSSFDFLYSAEQTTDGGYILVGYSYSNISGDKTENFIGSYGRSDYWIVKTDSSGNILWQNTIGGEYEEALTSIKQTTDGGYILGGFSQSNASGDKTENNYDTLCATFDYWIVKTDSLGNLIWDITIGGSDEDRLLAIEQTADNGFILGGFSRSNISGVKVENNIGASPTTDYWIVKTDSLGNIEWQNTIGGSLYDYLYSIKQTQDGGYILGGMSCSNISGDKTETCLWYGDYWIIKTDSLGTIQWQNTIGGNGNDALFSLVQTSDGGYLLGGESNSNISWDKTENSMGDFDYWIVKTNSVGNIQWQNTIGGSEGDFLESLQQTTDGGYILGGWSLSNISGDKTQNNCDSTLGYPDFWIVKTDAAGSIQWQNTIGGSKNDKLHSIEQTIDGGYILGGYSESDISGNKTENCIGYSDYWIVKLTPETITSSVQTPYQQLPILISPNPFTDKLNVTVNNSELSEIILYDMTARKIMQMNFTNSITLNTEQLAKGLYIYELRIKNGMSQKGKIVKD